MNLHEHQGKELLASFELAFSEEFSHHETLVAAKELTESTGTSIHVVKAQIHAGGRGKGGGVKLAKSLADLKKSLVKLLECNLLPHKHLQRGKK